MAMAWAASALFHGRKSNWLSATGWWWLWGRRGMSTRPTPIGAEEAEGVHSWRRLFQTQVTILQSWMPKSPCSSRQGAGLVSKIGLTQVRLKAGVVKRVIQTLLPLGVIITVVAEATI